MKYLRVVIKSLDEGTSSYVGNNSVSDGLRGVNRDIWTNSTDTEKGAGVSSFNVNGFGIDTTNRTNYNGDNYIAYQTLYTHIKWGLTNHGKKYVVAYNPKTNEVLPMWIGSGLAGHEIPSPVGVALDILQTKRLSNVADWHTSSDTFMDSSDGDYLILNKTNAIAAASTWEVSHQVDSIVLGSASGINYDDDTFIGYGKAKSETWTSGTYTGTGAAGNFVETKDSNGVARTPRRVVIKAVSATGNWVVYNSDSINYRLYLDLSNSEDYGVQVEFLSNGFNLLGTLASLNTDTVEYHYEVYFDTNSDGGGSYDDLASDTTQLNLTDRQMMFAEGYINGHANNTAEYNTGTETITPDNGWSDGNNYVYKEEGGLWYSTLEEPNIGKIDYGHSLVGGKFVDYQYIADGSTNTSITDSVPTMTSNTAPSGKASASTQYSAEAAFKAFDNDTTNRWIAAAVATGWLQYLLDSSKVINKYTISSAPSSYSEADRAPKDWTLEASNTGAFTGEEVVLDTVVGETSWGDAEKRTFTFSNANAYLYYRVDVTLNNGSSYLSIQEFELIEAQLDAGTPLTTPITYLDKTIEVSAGEIVDTHEFNYADTVLGFTELSGNVKIVDFGTAVNNNRYVIDNPFGNANYEGCIVRAELFYNSIWSEAFFVYIAGGQGTNGFSNAEGIVVQTGSVAVLNVSANSGGGHGTTASSVASAPCRVIVTYIGGAKDA